MSTKGPWQSRDECPFDKPTMCFRCPFKDCICTSVATTRAEAAYLKAAFWDKKLTRKRKKIKRLPLYPVRRFHVVS